MNVQRLAWTGVRLATPTATAYLDLLGEPCGGVDGGGRAEPSAGLAPADGRQAHVPHNRP